LAVNPQTTKKCRSGTERVNNIFGTPVCFSFDAGDFGKNISSTTPYCNQICEFDVDIEKEQHSITNSEKYYDLPEQISRNIMRKTYPQMIFEFVKQHFRSE
jgi:cysteine sulfinate desulfinase/cysteine desulfurase-like protein